MGFSAKFSPQEAGGSLDDLIKGTSTVLQRNKR